MKRYALGLPLVLVFASTACSEDDPGPGGNSGGSASGAVAGSGAGVGEGGEGSGAENGSGASGSGGESSGGSSGTGATPGTGAGGNLPTSCEGVVCQDRASCDDSSGSALCICDDGFSGAECGDVNECTSGTQVCGAGATCVNTFGSYYCECASGFAYDGSDCVAIDACDEDPCDANATCTGTPPAYACSCNNGYFGNGFSCSSTDYCDTENCGGNGTCVNTKGGAVCQCDAGYQGATCGNNTCATLTFDSSLLEEAVRAQIEKPTGDITQADIADHTYLSSNGAAVDSLGGLECWPHLEVLDMPFAGIGDVGGNADIAALAELNQLKELYLNCNSFTSIDVLENHPTLERLEIATCDGFTAVSDASALGSLASLKWLDISGLSASVASELGSLPALEVLFASDMGMTSIPATSGLLDTLYIPDNSISNLSGLSNFSYLYDVDISGNAITDWSTLPTLSQAGWFSAINVGVSTIPAADKIPQVGNLLLNENSISDLTPLQSSNMAGAGLGDNNITDLSPLVGSDFSGTLNVANNGIDCDEQAENLAALTRQGVRVLSGCP